MARITEKVAVDRISVIVCDRCQRRTQVGTPDFEAVTRIEHPCGYGSVWQDGAHVAADICEQCLQHLIGDFCRVRVTGDSLLLLKEETLLDGSDEVSCGSILTALTHELDTMNPDLLNILQRAANLLMRGDAIAAKSWLSEPAEGLNGKSPIQYATTVDKAREVLELIGRIKHGVFW